MSFLKRLWNGPAEPAVAWFNEFAVYENGDIERKSGEDAGRHSLDSVVIELDEGSALESRFTATRIFLVGVFALAFKKKKGGEKFLLIFGEDFQWLVEVPRKRINDATEFVHQVRAKQRAMSR